MQPRHLGVVWSSSLRHTYLSQEELVIAMTLSNVASAQTHCIDSDWYRPPWKHKPLPSPLPGPTFPPPPVEPWQPRPLPEPWERPILPKTRPPVLPPFHPAPIELS